MLSKEANCQDRYCKYTFKGKERDENILLILRRHWIVAVFEFLPILFYLVVIIFLHFFVFRTGAFFQVNINPDLVVLIETFFLMVFWLAVFIIWIDYYLDVWIITDQRIINIEQFGLFRRHVSELEHGKVQDVTTEVHGLLPTLLRYGFIYIQTAGEKERFVFKQVPNPTKVRKIIMQLQEYAILQDKKQEGAILRGKL